MPVRCQWCAAALGRVSSASTITPSRGPSGANVDRWGERRLGSPSFEPWGACHHLEQRIRASVEVLIPLLTRSDQARKCFGFRADSIAFHVNHFYLVKMNA